MVDETFKVAVATSDGINVDSHFGHVTELTIYEVDSRTGDNEPVESRKLIQSACKSGTCNDHEIFELISEQLSDIEYVLAAKIGPKAVQALSRKNITALDIVADIDEAIHKVRDYRDRKTLSRERARQILLNAGIED
ncbi:NifB/NifX family molybdenum-iron cluster-binding protein [Butyrivibrio sp.]|uniref:NifB/NifX family molybdenum-iron cluster-binding protein n=1 Tax=Butyrivibrio sp. TaxID=28121 RepID=UPI0025BFAFFE|nr:NifB/NifX family molybdenum-iron cluster-binding protein [Butyrivibrio sp.]MBQ9305909.1 hypothetical protein [Butyrivibrio sp.]